ncbi:MAG TPA: OsmC family protein [Solirubrobacterales bacterium]|nr:OsmC family protein [Solirubrobacterales bacterium]
MKIVAKRLAGFAHEVDLKGGDELIVDEPADRGGADSGPRPTQLLGASLAGCTAITIEMYADRKGWDVGAMEVTVEMDYEGEVPSSFAVSLTLPEELSDEQRRRLVVIAGKCPVHKVIARQTEVTVSERVEPF